MFVDIGLLLGGLIILVIGGELVVKGAVAFAKNLGVPVLIIGLTIVAFGTSAPEMVVSVQAVLEGMNDLSIGNVVGSNITNILAILGLTALIYPITVDEKILKRDAWWMMASNIIFIGCCFTGLITRPLAAVLLLTLAIYLYFLFRNAKSGADKEILEDMEEETDVSMPSWKAILFILIGLAAMVAGSDLMVQGASSLASSLGVSEAMIGLTIVALGTSAPELMTCVVAAYRRHSDIAIGNIIGSNLFNAAMIPGVAGMVVPITINPLFLRYDMWILLGVSALLMVFMFTGRKISRTEGIIFFIGYIAFTVWQAQQGVLPA